MRFANVLPAPYTRRMRYFGRKYSDNTATVLPPCVKQSLHMYPRQSIILNQLQPKHKPSGMNTVDTSLPIGFCVDRLTRFYKAIPMSVTIKTETDIAHMRVACRLASEVRLMFRATFAPSSTTENLLVKSGLLWESL